LLNFLSEDGEKSRSHGIKAEILNLQAKAIGIPLIQIKTSWENYEENFKKVVIELKGKGIEGGVFGDMELEGHREWIERVCAELQIEAILPLWGIAPRNLLTEFWENGFKAIVVATRLNESLLGRSLDKAFLSEIQKFNSHPCGENGEYHTFVTAGPLFRKPLELIPGKKEKRDGMWFLEFSPN
jgi:uncharacterized protein (TIGR00290 family)